MTCTKENDYFIEMLYLFRTLLGGLLGLFPSLPRSLRPSFLSSLETLLKLNV